MKVKDVMTREVQSCGADTNLAEAAKMMWDSDCGVLPVLDREGKVIGIITDRDICMAVATKHKSAAEIAVWETISGKVYGCALYDDIKDALKTMEREQVRRLPVVNGDGLLQGILCMNDIVLHAEEAKGKKLPDLSYEDVMRTLKSICAHRVLVGI